MEQPLWKPAQPQSEHRHLIPPDSFFLLLLGLLGNALLRIAFGATVDSGRYQSVSMDSQEIRNHLDERVYGW